MLVAYFEYVKGEDRSPATSVLMKLVELITQFRLVEVLFGASRRAYFLAGIFSSPSAFILSIRLTNEV
jgi:hypothetical protein